MFVYTNICTYIYVYTYVCTYLGGLQYDKQRPFFHLFSMDIWYPHNNPKSSLQAWEKAWIADGGLIFWRENEHVNFTVTS